MSGFNEIDINIKTVVFFLDAGFSFLFSKKVIVIHCVCFSLAAASFRYWFTSWFGLLI